ncbi:MAG: hypothetical protein WC289_06455 [Patescibacteria group bacterium]|jgi:hypothetical protein
MNIRRGLLVIALVIGFSAFAVSSAHAITLIPPSVEFELTPGQEYQTVVKLFNEEERNLVVYAEVKNFGPQGETGIPSYDLEAPVSGLSAWITVAPEPYTIEPGERIEIPVKVNPPLNAEPGGHYAAVFFTEKGNTDGGGQVGIGKGVGILLLARVSGETVEAGSIKEFSVGEGSMLNRLPILFTTRFENTGNVHLRPTGLISIKNMFGRSVDTVDVNSTKGATLPDSIRKYESTWERTQIKETTGSTWKDFWVEFGNERDNFALGKYTASLSIDAGKETSIHGTASVTFWVWPWHVIIVYVLIGLLVILLLIWFIKHYNKWLISRVMNAANTSSAQVKGVKPSSTSTTKDQLSKTLPANQQKK